MRFINLDDLQPRIQQFLEPLEDARERVLAEDDPDRRLIIARLRRRRGLAALRDVLEAFSHGKCWYVECKNPGANNEVDHYRPKLSVYEDPAHPGYYWLAFDWRNLRLSCQRANRLGRDPETGVTGGKGDHFPLLNPTERARTPADALALEQPALLDPTVRDDPAVLSFAATGEVELSPRYQHDPIALRRFELSRRYFHLDWPAFCEARMELYNMILREVEQGEREAAAWLQHSANTGPFEEVIQRLRRRIDHAAEYSAAARTYVQLFRHVWWIQDIVLRMAR